MMNGNGDENDDGSSIIIIILTVNVILCFDSYLSCKSSLLFD